MNTSTLASGHCRRICAPALPVDVEQVVRAVLQRAVDGVDGGSVAVAVNDRPFRELLPLDHARELVVGDELVVHAVAFAGARRAGRVRHREDQLL